MDSILIVQNRKVRLREDKVAGLPAPRTLFFFLKTPPTQNRISLVTLAVLNSWNSLYRPGCPETHPKCWG